MYPQASGPPRGGPFAVGAFFSTNPEKGAKAAVRGRASVPPVSWLTDLFSKRSLDDRLLSGGLSPDSGRGKARAEELLNPRHRAKSAQALRELVEEADEHHASIFSADLKVNRLAIRSSKVEVLSLARDLEELPDVDPRGVILADRLVTDGESPAYVPGAYMEDNGQLARAVERARDALKAD